MSGIGVQTKRQEALGPGHMQEKEKGITHKPKGEGAGISDKK